MYCRIAAVVFIGKSEWIMNSQVVISVSICNVRSKWWFLGECTCAVGTQNRLLVLDYINRSSFCTLYSSHQCSNLVQIFQLFLKFIFVRVFKKKVFREPLSTWRPLFCEKWRFLCAISNTWVIKSRDWHIDDAVNAMPLLFSVVPTFRRYV